MTKPYCQSVADRNPETLTSTFQGHFQSANIYWASTKCKSLEGTFSISGPEYQEAA